jgi:hypothetical protein
VGRLDENCVVISPKRLKGEVGSWGEGLEFFLLIDGNMPLFFVVFDGFPDITGRTGITAVYEVLVDDNYDEFFSPPMGSNLHPSHQRF